MAKWKSREGVVDAIQLRWTTWCELNEILEGIISPDNPARFAESFSDTCGELSPYIELTIPMDDGDLIAQHGDYIIKDASGKVYSCKPDVFVKTHKPAILADIWSIVSPCISRVWDAIRNYIPIY